MDMYDTLWATSVRLTLRDRVRKLGVENILRQMGYSKTDDACNRLRRVLDDKLLGLDAGEFDFRYTSEQFLDQLALRTGIDSDQLHCEKTRIREVIEIRRNSFRPVLFVDTGFKRRNQPLAVLALAESKRRITFDRVFLDMRLREQVEIACRRAREHYTACEGRLPIWGGIKQYEFHYAHDRMYLIDCAGSIVQAADAVAHDRASMRVMNGLP